MPKRMFTEAEAELYGARRICYKEGHQIYSLLDEGVIGGVPMYMDGYTYPVSNAASDEIKCHRCDAKFTVTYPEIGTVVP